MVALRLFGPPMIVHDCGAAPLPAERLGQLALALAVRGDWLPREQLVALLWPELSDEAARRNLRKLLFRARQQPWFAELEVRADAIRWAIGSDLADFTSACGRRDWAAALAAHTAVFADGYDTRSALSFDEWLRFERSRLAQMFRLAAAQRLAQLADDLAAREIVARRWLALDPFDDDALAAVVDALRSQGRGAEARRAVAEFVERLGDELGVEPSVRVRALAEPAPTAVGPAVAEAGFVGRRSELAELAALLARDDCRLLTLIGPGGIGKSRLARVAFADARRRFDVSRWIGLDDLAQTAQVLPRLAAALGVEPGGGDLLATVAESLHGGPALLVFDNAEHLPGFARLCDRLLSACTALKIVVTSRARLASAGEWLLPLAGLPVPDADETEPEVLRSFDAVKAFELRARAVAPAFDGAANAEATARLVRLLDGAPLAIELAAAWVRLLPVAEIRSEIGRSLDLLEGSGTTPDRQRSVRASFEHSWRLLAPLEQRSLARLAVFAAPFGREAAAQVAGAGLPVLAALVDRSLLRAEGDGRFSFHALMRQCARAKLADEAAVRQRHCDYVARTLAHYTEAGAGRAAILGEIDAALEDCLEAWRWAQSTAQHAALEAIAPVLGSFFVTKNRLDEGIALFATARQELADSAAGRGARAEVLRALGTLQYHRGDSAAAIEAIRQALRLYRPLRRPPGLRRCLQVLGLLRWQRGELAAARRCYEESLKLSERQGDEVGRAQPLTGLAMCDRASGDYDRALARYREALALYRRSGNAVSEGRTLNNLGNVLRAMRDWDHAHQQFTQSLAVAERHGIDSLRSFCLVNLGLTDAARGRAGEAQRWFELALRDEQSCGETLASSDLRMGLAQVALARGDRDAARRWLHEALLRARRREHAPDMLAVLAGIAELLAADGERERAIELLTLVATHPHTESGERSEARRRIDALAPAPAEADAARRLARGLQLDALTDALLAELDD